MRQAGIGRQRWPRVRRATPRPGGAGMCGARRARSRRGSRERRCVRRALRRFGRVRLRVRCRELLRGRLVRRDHRLEGSGRRRPLGVRRWRDEHGADVGRRRIEFERILRNRLLFGGSRRGGGSVRERDGQELCRCGRRIRLRGRGCGCGGLRRFRVAHRLRRGALVRETRECVEDARAAPAAHVALRDAQIRRGHDQRQGALWTDGEHACEAREPRPSAAPPARHTQSPRSPHRATSKHAA